jgi:hypothetical protein
LEGGFRTICELRLGPVTGGGREEGLAGWLSLGRPARDLLWRLLISRLRTARRD